ncbi:hypothetical protein D9M70_636320 [compost metagenome]
MGQQLIGDDRKTPTVRQAGQQRVTTHHLGSTIVGRVQSQAAVRFQTDVVAVNQPGFRMGRVIRYEDVARG